MHSPMPYQRISKTTNLTADDIDDTDPFPKDSNGKRQKLDVDYLDTWKAMEVLVQTGNVRSLGVSNFNSQQLDRLISSATIKPVANQIEYHPNLNQRKLIEFSNARNITTIAYSPLSRPHAVVGRSIAINHPKVKEIGVKYGKNPGQIVLRYLHQNGVVIIPKSTNRARIRGNIDIFDFNLNTDEMKFLDSLGDNQRLIEFSDDKDNKYYPFSIEY